MIIVKSVKEGAEYELKNFDSEKRLLNLENGISIIDSNADWMYYSGSDECWYPCF